MKTIAIANQKGGVGKTTTCVNLAATLTEAGQRILLCDFDPQANSTSGMGVDKTVSKGIYDALIGEVPVEDALVHTKYGDVLPSNKALAGAGIELIGMERREFLLRDALDKVKDRYDFLFIDCPPSLELLTLNALCAADAILVPVQGEYYALEGLSDLMNTVRIVRRSLSDQLMSNSCSSESISSARSSGSASRSSRITVEGRTRSSSQPSCSIRSSRIVSKTKFTPPTCVRALSVYRQRLGNAIEIFPLF